MLIGLWKQLICDNIVSQTKVTHELAQVDIGLHFSIPLLLQIEDLLHFVSLL